MYLKLNRLEEAEAANARSLELRLALYGENHAQYANALAGLGAIRLARGDYSGALTVLDRALAISQATGHGESLEAAAKLGNRARALLNLGRAQDALLALDLAEPIIKRLVPNDHERMQDLLADRVEALDQLDRTEDARTVARAALALDITPGTLDARRLERLRSLAR
jgi:tetratricopeptide (TPR) repeat protein